MTLNNGRFDQWVRKRKKEKKKGDILLFEPNSALQTDHSAATAAVGVSHLARSGVWRVTGKSGILSL